MTLTINKACKQALLFFLGGGGVTRSLARAAHERKCVCAEMKWRACSQAAINIARPIKCVSPKRQKTEMRKYFSNYEFSYSYVLCIYVLCI